MRIKVEQLVRQTIEHPFECITEISKYVTSNCTMDVPYSHIWTSYIADKVGLGDTQAPFTASCDKGANWFRRRKRYKLGQAYGGDYAPYPGDYIYCSSTYEQADATDVGIVLDSNGTFVRFVHWEDGCPKEEEWYNHNPHIIGYGIPEYEDADEVEMPRLATQGNAVAIMIEQIYVHIGPDKETANIGTLRKGHAVEVLGVTPSGWLKVVWGLAPSGYGFIDNTKFFHWILRDEIPYPKYEGFQVGDRVQFKGGKLSKQLKGKAKKVNPFIGKVTSAKGEKFYLESPKVRGWVDKTDVDFVTEVGYNRCKGEVIEDKACLRIGPGTEFTKVQKWPQMVKGNTVDILGVDTDSHNYEWYLIVINGIKGYVEDYCINIIEA